MKSETNARQLLKRLQSVLDAKRRLYRELNGGRDLGGYLSRPMSREDEELLTEPVLVDLLERVLGFPKDGYFPQLGRSGSKPDLTPLDLVAHRFVLDAKSSAQDLAGHEAQIRRYIDQRQLDYGVLFNLRELRTYRRGQQGHDPDLSFHLLPLWQVARGESLTDPTELDRLLTFHRLFAYQELDTEAKIGRIRQARSWAEREARGETVEIDLDFLVNRLRELSIELAEDAGAQHEVLTQKLRLSPDREEALLRELELLALDLAPGVVVSTLPATVEDYRLGEGLPARVWHQYLLRVSQLALTRLLLYRSWEDVEFVEGCLYDGGFVQVYERVGQSIQHVLREAFEHGRERYRWLYGDDNNYDWYRPRDSALVDVLYALVPVPLGKLDADVLGGLYESYVDEIDRDRLGQFFTPRAVVRFMLDRAGFAGPTGVFRLEGDERKPRRVLDFATGSGGFLVEAARRVIDDGGLRLEDPRDATDALVAIARGFHGSEISPFPYYLTEVNLLLQVSRLLGALRVAGVEEPPSFVLGVVHGDSLGTRAGPHESLEGLDPESRLDRAELIEDRRFGLAPLDSAKRAAFRRMREDSSFDLVVGNPPYVFESNNRILFDRLRGLPGWRDLYRGKSDYLYYFLLLAAEKVAPGGRLCVITPAGWMNAGAADWLRERLAGLLRLDELFLFGSYRLFAPERETRGGRRRAPTPTVESAILLATKGDAPPDHRLRIVALENEVEAAAALGHAAGSQGVDRDRLLAEMARRVDGRSGRSKGLHVHRLRQEDLVHDRPWPIKFGTRDVAARVVAHLQSALDDSAAPVEQLGARWHVFQGIQTGADAYTKRIQRRIPADLRARLEADGARTGDPILELPPGREREAPWCDHPEVLARSPESRAILYGALDDGDYASLVWLGRQDPAPAAVVEALERWKPVLSTRADFVANRERRWFETHRVRDKAQLRAPKVIALYRTDRGRFALDETGDWQPSIKTTICTAREPGLSVAYLCGLLNSELLDLWYEVRGKTPRDVWRNYEPKPMSVMPYRHVEVDGAAPDPPELRALLAAIDAEDGYDALAAADALVGDAASVRGLEALVRAVAANRRALLPHRRVMPNLGSIVKDPWRIGPAAVDQRSAAAGLSDAESLSIRVDPALHSEVLTDGPVGSARPDGDRLTFTRGTGVTMRVSGPAERLDLLAALVAGRRLLPREVEAIRLPTDLAAWRGGLSDREKEVRRLLDAGRLLVEAAERVVCRLYGVPRDLEDEVVAHAVRRAGSAPPPVESGAD